MTVDLTTNGLNVSRTQNHFFTYLVNGLRPLTKHAITIDGVDHLFATRQFGKAFGADLITDSNGSINFGFLYEIEFNRNMNFELPQRQTMSFQSDVIDAPRAGRQASKVIVNNKIIELISPDGQSQTQIVLPLNIILSAGPVRTLYPVE